MFDDSDVDGGVFAEFIGAGEASGASTNDDNVSVSVGDHVSHVTAGHFSGHHGFFDGLELKGVKVVGGSV